MNKKLTGLLAGLVFALNASMAQAVPLQDLLDGASIIVDDKVFDDWVLDGNTGSVTPDLRDIDILPLGDDPLNPGLEFIANGNLITSGTDFIALFIGFSVSTLDGSVRIKDNSLEINEFEFGITSTGGYIEIDEVIEDVAGTFLGDKTVLVDNRFNIFDLFDSANFQPQSSISVSMGINVGGDGAEDIVSLDKFTMRFSQVPEPTTVALMGLGLAGIGYRRKKAA